MPVARRAPPNVLDASRDNLLDRFARLDRDGRYSSPIASPTKRFFTMLGTLVGGRVSVPTIDGQRDIKVPPGSGDGTVLRMAGYGVPGEDGARGDQLVTLALELPDALDDAARAELERALAAAALTFPASRRFEEQIDES